jgi:MFS family permease
MRGLGRAFNPIDGIPHPIPLIAREDAVGAQATRLEERAMRNLWWDGFFAESAEVIWLQYFTLYALALGASFVLIGVLAALTNLFAAVSMWPGSIIAERTRRYRMIVLVNGGVLSRLPFLALAAIPWIATGNPALGIIVVVAALRGFFGNVALPAWSAYCADFVPAGLRGRYFASRNLIRQVADLAVAPLVGLVIFLFGGLSGWQVAWVAAFSLGMVSTAFFWRIPSESAFGAHERKPVARVAGKASLLRDRRLVWFVVTSGVFQLSVMIAGPFFSVYFVRELGASTLWVGITAAMMPLAGILAQPFLGRLNDRLGPKWILVASGLFFPIAPWAWMLATEPWHIIFINLIAGVLWAANLLASFNLLLSIAPEDRRASYAGMQQAAIFAGSFLGPLIGGVLIATIGFKSVFFLSGAGRFLASLILWRVVDDFHAEPVPAHEPLAEPIPAPP